MENLSLILSDLDGTLFHNDKTVSKYTQNVIKKAQNKGILFAISTSRAIRDLRNYIPIIGPDIIISNGGGLVTRNGEQLYKAAFSLEETRALISKTYELLGPEAEITIDNEEHMYWNRPRDKASICYDDSFTYNDLHNLAECAMKVCVHTADKSAADAIAAAIGRENTDYSPFSDIPWYKFSSYRATKENAIQALSQTLDIPVTQMVAFGDDYNDIGMLKLCGTGIAMENAIPEVKAVANGITLSNEVDGVAAWIEEYLL